MPEIEFSIRDFSYPVSIYRLRREFERTQWYDTQQMAEYQHRRLRRVVAQAFENVPYYRKLFQRYGLRPTDIETAEDLKRLPVLRKLDVREHGDDLLAIDATRFRPKKMTTSGTTGRPISFYLDRHSRVLEFVYYWRHWSWAGYRLGTSVAQLNAAHFVGCGIDKTVSRWQPHLKRLLLNSTALSEQNIGKFAEELRRYRSKYLKGLAGPLHGLALLFREVGIDDITFQAVFSTGESLYPARRKVIESVFGCRVLDSFGLLEQAAAICECPEGGYHINGDYSLLELLPADAAGAENNDLRKAVGSTLHNMSMPLLRYDVGDLIEPAPAGQACPCGRTLPLVKDLHGRYEEAVVTPDGRYVTALFLVPELVENVAEVQFVQEDERSLVSNVVPLNGFHDGQEEQFLSLLRDLVGDEMNLRLRRVSPDQIRRGPTGKVPLVVSTVARIRAHGDDGPPVNEAG